MPTLQSVLLQELQMELDSTRRVIANLPATDFSWKPHEKSMSIAKLAGHTSDLPYLIRQILTTPKYDFASDDREPDDPTTVDEALVHFDKVAKEAIEAMKQASDDTLFQEWSLTYGGHPVYSGIRYMAYRTTGLNHLIHHRAQMGVYLRLLNAPVPDTYGPTADTPWEDKAS